MYTVDLPKHVALVLDLVFYYVVTLCFYFYWSCCYCLTDLSYVLDLDIPRNRISGSTNQV